VDTFYTDQRLLFAAGMHNAIVKTKNPCPEYSFPFAVSQIYNTTSWLVVLRLVIGLDKYEAESTKNILGLCLILSFAARV